MRELAEQMLGSTLVTIQTGPEGKTVNRLYIEQGIDIATELYLSVLLDRATSRNIVMASTEGGTEIEVVAEETPELILKEEIDPAFGLLDFQASAIAAGLGLTGDAQRNGVRFLKALTSAAVELDTDLVEINPLVVTKDGQVMALDGKMSFEANALYRHPDVVALRDESEEDAAELAAQEYGLSFIKLDGTIGCMVNGAGLAMSTMDIINHVGGEPANFLDVGGGADKDQIAAAFKIITKDPNVKGIFVNIFGGIMRCDTIAEGVVAAVKEVGLDVPLVVRLEGTNVEIGKQDHRRVRPQRGECRGHEGRGDQDRGACQMSVLVNKNTKVLVQGLGKTGRFHTDKAIAYGTNMVGAVHPSRAGTSEVFAGETDQSGVQGRSDTYEVELPIFRTVAEAVDATGADATVVYVPPPFAADAIMEAADTGVPLIIAITEGIPVADMVIAKRYLQDRNVRLVGPNCPGVITPQECKIGIMPGYIHTPGGLASCLARER